MEKPEDIALFILMGLILTSIALIPPYLSHRRAEKLRATGKRVRGKVMSCQFHFGKPSGWKSIVRFTTQQGQVVEAEYAKNLSLRLTPGQPVWIVYDEKTPHNFVL